MIDPRPLRLAASDPPSATEGTHSMSNAATVCRSCAARGLVPILSLGHTPLANRLLTAAQLHEREPRYPLDLAFCPQCTLVQITLSVPPDELFGDYAYFSSFSDGMLRHVERLTGELMRSLRLGPTSLAAEIASNDGYLLQYYHRAGIPVLGIEPAANIAQVARRERGIPTLCEFFGRELAQRLSARAQRADVVHAHNVLAHVPDLTGFVEGLALLVKDDGLVVVEVPYVKDLVDHVEFDTIYHEHLCYFSLTALAALFARAGLVARDVERVPIHGGSLRLYAARGGSPGARVAALLAEEAAWGVDRPEPYQSFAGRVQSVRQNLLGLLERLKREGRRIAVYGASAKGSTLLNYCGIGAETVDYVVDRSTVKQGRFTPGTHLRIYSPERLESDRPDFVLLLSWNFADEILAQQSRYRAQGGRFIIPIPHVKVA